MWYLNPTTRTGRVVAWRVEKKEPKRNQLVYFGPFRTQKEAREYACTFVPFADKRGRMFNLKVEPLCLVN